MIADVMFDENLNTWGLSIEQWNEALDRIIDNFFPELAEEHVRVRFTEKYYEEQNCKLTYDGHFDPNIQAIFINNWWMDKEKYPDPLECIARILVHEMKHYVQCIQGRLSEDLARSYIATNPLVPWEDRPWESEAIYYEKKHRMEAYGIILMVKK